MSGLEPMISVKAAVIAPGATGLAVRAANISPIQNASDFGKKQESGRERGGERREVVFLYSGIIYSQLHTAINTAFQHALVFDENKILLYIFVSSSQPFKASI